MFRENSEFLSTSTYDSFGKEQSIDESHRLAGVFTENGAVTATKKGNIQRVTLYLLLKLYAVHAFQCVNF